jgi:hypothetical protein
MGRTGRRGGAGEKETRSGRGGVLRSNVKMK